MRKNRFFSKFRFLKLTMGLSVLIVGTFCALSVAGDYRLTGNPFELIFDLEQRVTNLEQQSTASGIEVYDAEGQFLGFVSAYSSSDFINIYLPLEERVVAIFLTNGESTQRPLYFESSDCSGVPYISVSGTYSIHRNLDKYYIGEKTYPIEIQTGSELSPWNLPACSSSSSVSSVVPAYEVQAPISFPVSLPLSFQKLD